MVLDRERWRWVVGYEGLYMVSDMGHVITAPHGYKDGLNLKPLEANNGYFHVNLYKDGTYFKALVHRIVAKAFIPNPENKSQVNHKNGVKSDNRAENLEWVTARENIRHKFDVLHKPGSMLGKPSKLRRFTDDQVRAIRNDKRKPSVICLDYGVSRQCISDVQKRKYYKEVV